MPIRHSADQGTNIRLRLRCSFRLLSFGYVLNDDLRLTQPIRAAHPFDEILLYICRERSTNQLLFMQNKPNLRRARMNVNSLITKYYRKNDDFVVRLNKPNFRYGQNERKLTYNKGLQKKRLFSTPKNKPKQTQFTKGQNEQKIACRKIRPHPRTRSLTFRWSSHSIIPCLIGRTMLCNVGSS